MKIQQAPSPQLQKALPAVEKTPAPEAAAPQPQDQVQLPPAGDTEDESWFGDMKNAFFTEKRVEGQETQGSPFMKLMFGAVVASAAWAGTKVAMDIISSPSLAVGLGKAALNVGALAGGYLMADLPSGLLHHWADNYAQPDAKNPFVRKFAKQAQRHHFYPGKLGHYSLSYWAFPLSTVGWMPLAAGAALGVPSPLLSGAIGLVGGMSVYGKYHQWSHSPKSEVPAHGKFLQKVGLAVDPKNHGQHHRMPWNSDYCIVHGHLNGPMNAIKFWPRYEKAVYAITGAKPESWNVPEYKDYVDGKISKEEYIVRSKEMMKVFRETEMPARKEKWGITG